MNIYWIGIVRVIWLLGSYSGGMLVVEQIYVLGEGLAGIWPGVIRCLAITHTCYPFHIISYFALIINSNLLGKLPDDVEP